MKSYVILEVFRIEIEQIIFSRFRNGTEKISGIIFFLFAEVNKNVPSQAYFIGSVGKGETNNILILASDQTKIPVFPLNLQVHF